MAMDGVLSSARDLPPLDQISYGLEAAEKLLEDGVDFLAVTRLQQLANVVGQYPAASDQLSRFHAIFARALSARASLEDAFAAIEAALPQSSTDERGRLEAERAELLLLNGDLDEAERAAAAEEYD